MKEIIENEGGKRIKLLKKLVIGDIESIESNRDLIDEREMVEEKIGEMEVKRVVEGIEIRKGVKEEIGELEE